MQALWGLPLGCAHRTCRLQCGNLANLMFVDGEPFAIDNNTNAYDTAATDKAAAQFEQYLEDVGALAARTRRRAGGADEPAHPAFEGLRKLFLHGQGVPEHPTFLPGLGYDIQEMGVRAIEAGFLAVCEDLASSAQRGVFAEVEEQVLGELGWQVFDDHRLSVELDFAPGSAAFFQAVAAALA